jgi:hypothetical protein
VLVFLVLVAFVFVVGFAMLVLALAVFDAALRLLGQPQQTACIRTPRDDDPMGRYYAQRVAEWQPTTALAATERTGKRSRWRPQSGRLRACGLCSGVVVTGT